MSEAENPCPCNQTLTDTQINFLNFGMQNYNNLITDPNAGSINSIRSISDNLLSGLGAGINSALPSLGNLVGSLNTQAQIIDQFAAESARLSSPQGLISTISSLSLYAQLNCLFGIEGLNIGVGLDIINQNGQFAIQGVLNANLGIQQLLGGLGNIDANNPNNSGVIQDLDSKIIENLQGLDDALQKANGVLVEALNMQSQAAAFIERFTNVSAIADLINQANTNPCFQFSAQMNGSLINNQFLNGASDFYNSNAGVSFR